MCYLSICLSVCLSVYQPQIIEINEREKEREKKESIYFFCVCFGCFGCKAILKHFAT